MPDSGTYNSDSESRTIAEWNESRMGAGAEREQKRTIGQNVSEGGGSISGVVEDDRNGGSISEAAEDNGNGGRQQEMQECDG